MANDPNISRHGGKIMDKLSDIFGDALGKIGESIISRIPPPKG